MYKQVWAVVSQHTKRPTFLISHYRTDIVLSLFQYYLFVLALPLWLHMFASAHLELTTDPRHFLTLHTLVHRLSGTLLPTFPIVSFHFVEQKHTAIHIPEIDALDYNTRIWKVRDQYSMSASRKPDVLFCIALPSHNSQTSGALPSGKCHILIVTFLVHPHVLDGHGCGVGDGHRSR
jgi:hypothetical protein